MGDEQGDEGAEDENARKENEKADPTPSLWACQDIEL
jgi:hypothetical protein